MSELKKLAESLQMAEDRLREATSLDLRPLRITSLPDVISQLTQLKQLIVSLAVRRDRTHEIPPWISCLNNLEKLVIENGNIRMIPAEVGALSRLTELEVSSNQIFSVHADIGKLTNLQSLNLSNNKLETLPATIGKLKKLSKVDLSNNLFTLYKKKAITLNDFDAGEVERSPVVDAALDKGYVLLTKKMKPAETVPPELFLLPKGSMTLIGNPELPVRFISRFQNLMRKTDDPIKRALDIIRFLKKLPRINPKVIDLYEIFVGRNLKEEIHAPVGRGKEAKEARLIGYIRMASKADCLIFMEHPIVQGFVREKWTNGVRFWEYMASALTSASSGSGKTNESFSTKVKKYMGLSPKIYENIIVPFVGSIKAKFIIFSLFYVYFLVALSQYLTYKNTGLGEPKYFLSSYLANAFAPPDSLSVDTLWDYLQGDFLDTLFDGPDSYDDLASEGQETIPESYYRPIGKVSIRQLRSPKIPCLDIIPQRTTDLVNGTAYCVRPIQTRESHSPYGPNGQYKYTKSSSKGRLYPIYGALGNGYDDDGYIERLEFNKNDSYTKLEDLKSNYWIDMETRVITIDFLVGNKNLELVALITIILELPVSGGILPSIQADAVPAGWIQTDVSDYFLTQLTILIYIIGLVVYEYGRINTLGIKYFTSMWCVFDFVFLLNLICVAVTDILLYTENMFSSGKPTGEIFYNFESSMYLYIFQTRLTSVLSLIAWLRLLYIQSIHPSIGPMQLIVFAMMKDILLFLFMLVIFLMALSSASFVIFAGLQSHYNLTTSVASIIRTLFGDYNYGELTDADHILGPVYFFLILVLCSLMLLNLLIAILSATYNQIQMISERQYKQLFAEAVLELQTAPFPVPLNILTPLYRLVRSWWVPRMELYPIIFSVQNMRLHMQAITPIPQRQRYWNDELLKKYPKKCLLIDRFVWKLTSLIANFFILLLTPFYYLLKVMGVKSCRKLDIVVMLMIYLFMHLLWLLTLPFWGAIWSFHSVSEKIRKARSAKKENVSKVRLSEDVDQEVLDEALGEGDIDVVSLPSSKGTIADEDDEDYDDSVPLGQIPIIVKDNSDGVKGNVDVTISGQGEGYALYRVFHPLSVTRPKNEFEVTIYNKSVSIGLIPMDSKGEDLPGLAKNSIAYESSTGKVFMNGSEYTAFPPDPWDGTGQTVVCWVDFHEEIVYFRNSRRTVEISITNIESLKLCPAVVVVGSYPCARMKMISFDDESKETSPSDLQLIDFESPNVGHVCAFGNSEAIVHSGEREGTRSVLSNVEQDDKWSSCSIGITMVNFGKTGYITTGLAKDSLDRTEDIGRGFDTIGIRVDRRRMKMVVQGAVGEKQYSISSPIQNVADKEAIEIGMHLYIPPVSGTATRIPTLVFSLNRVLVRKMILNLPEDIKGMRFGVTLNSAGQTVFTKQYSYPKWIHEQKKYIDEMTSLGEPIEHAVLVDMSKNLEEEEDPNAKLRNMTFIERFYVSSLWEEEQAGEFGGPEPTATMSDP